jgi:hypothetical protein
LGRGPEADGDPAKRGGDGSSRDAQLIVEELQSTQTCLPSDFFV